MLELMMRWIALAAVCLSVIVFAALLGGNRVRRDWAVFAIGALAFCVGELSLAASPYVWPGWQGLEKGIVLSLIDSLALALLVTRIPGRYSLPFLWLIALYFLATVASLISASNRLAGLFIVFQILKMILLYVAVACELHRPSAVRALLKGLSIGLLIQAGFVARQKVGGMVQAGGTFEHQNVLGMAVELSALPLIAAVMEGERSKLVYVGVIAGAICLAGGGSRGSMGFFAIGLVLLVTLSLVRRSTRRKWQIVAIGVLASAAIVPLGIATLTDRFGGDSFTTEETSREALAEAARSMASDNLLGVGANNFVTMSNVGGYLARTGIDVAEGTRRQPAHNAYLLARAETGWFGEGALILLLGGTATLGVATAFRKRRVRYAGISLGSACAILAIALHSNFEYALLKSDVQTLFFLNAALVAGIAAIAKSGRTKRMTSELPGRGNHETPRPSRTVASEP